MFRAIVNALFCLPNKRKCPATLSQDELKELLERRPQRELGQGGSCRVVLVEHEGAECCLKVCTARQGAAFQDEAVVLQKLKGAGGAPLLLGVTEGEAQRQALLTTFCGKSTFLQLAREAPTDVEKLQALLGLCRALRQVHAHGFVHNDIKADNVVLRRDARDDSLRVSLIDYGLARRAGVPLLAPGESVRRMPWMAPEVFHGVPCRPSADVFSLGVLVQRVLARCRGDYQQLEAVAKRATSRCIGDRPSVKAVAREVKLCLRAATAATPAAPKAHAPKASGLGALLRREWRRPHEK